jgi:hypothetical protein
MVFNFHENPPSHDAAKVFYVRVDPNVASSEELLKSLYYLLRFPGYFGFNWDALNDCLRDLEWIPCRKVVLVHAVLPNLPEEDLKIYLEILRDSVLDWQGSQEHELEIFFPLTDMRRIEEILAN